MALPALKEVYDALEAEPMPRSAGIALSGTGRDFRERVKTVMDGIETAFQRWSFQMITRRRGLEQSTREYIGAGADRASVLHDLATLQNQIERGIEIRQERLSVFEREAEDVQADISKNSIENARFFRKQARKFATLSQKEIQMRESFRLFLTTLQADIDPDARGGPKFDNADELLAFLHSQV